MKNKLSTIALVGMFLLGFIILLYPQISDFYNKRVGSYLIASYENQVKNLSENDVEVMLENAQKYNEDLIKKPIKLVNGDSKDKNYLSQLTLSDSVGIIGYIEIDKIDVRLPIYHTTSEPVLQRGVGHLEGTSLPIGGDGQHSVLTGHTGLPSSKIFTDLDEMDLGDHIVLKILNEPITYVVDNIEVVKPDEVNDLKPRENEDLLTLVTCTPYGVNSHRLLVQASRTDNIEELIVDEDTKNSSPPILIFGVVATAILGVLWIRKSKNKK